MTYIVNEDLNYDFTESEIIEMLDLWHLGLSLEEISTKLNRDYDEVGLALYDIAENTTGLVPIRSHGIMKSNPVIKHKYFNDNFNSILGRHFKQEKEYQVFSRKSLNFFWEANEVLKFDEAFKDNCSLEELTTKFRRNHTEILLIMVDRIRKGRINSNVWRFSYE